jgi:hypothetical protein
MLMPSKGSLNCLPAAELVELFLFGIQVARQPAHACRAISNDVGALLPHRMYVITVLEQVGDAVITENYYNYGTYSDLWRATKTVQASVSLPRVLSSTDAERWAAMLPPLLLHLQPLCPHSVCSAYVQVSVHLSTALRTDSRSLSIPVEHTERLDLWRLYISFLASCPPYVNAKRPPTVMSCEEVRNHLLAILKGDVELHIQIAQAALGSCHPEHLPPVLQVCAYIFNLFFVNLWGFAAVQRTS